MSHTNDFAPITKIFHWLTALLILIIIPLGVIANGAPYETSEELAQKAWLFSLHKTLGVAVFFVALLRILWALSQHKPGPLHPDRKAETLVAEIVHWVLYISLVAVPLTGWIEHSATSGFAPIWWPFGQSLPLIPQSETLAGVFAGLHWMFGKLMVASILLHIAGALKHHFIDKDATLRRMWFGANGPDVPPHKANVTAPITAGVIFLVAAGLAYNLGFLERHGEAIVAADLAEVSSDWMVEDGEISISISQFGSDVTGSFAEWTSDITFDPTPADVMGSVETVVSIGSLTLGSVTAEAMGPDFFDAETHPTAVFAAEIKPDANAYVADGTLTIKGNSVPVQLPFVLDLEGNTAQMAGSLNVNRMDFGVGTSQADESSLAFAVEIMVNLTATKSEAPE